MNTHARLSSIQSSHPEDRTRRRQVQALYRALAPDLVDYAAKRLDDEEAAEVVVQDAFVALLEGRYPVPAVDVRRKLEGVVKALCRERLRTRTEERGARRALREAAVHAESAGWRAWRLARRSRRDPREERQDEEVLL